jgi:Terminase large subunit, T4likevirus-type, N-terminal
LGFVPDPWQANFFESERDRIIINASRQSGKSTTTSVVALHTALYQRGSLTLILSPTLRQSGELFTKVMQFYRELGRPVGTRMEQRSQVEFANGSRILSLPGADGGASIRGFSPQLIVVDEASRVEDALYYAVRPMLAVSRGRLILLSTPNGTQGAFHEEWTYGADRWQRFEVPASACPRISPEFLEEERHALPLPVYQQEYECRFIEGHGQFFSEDAIQEMWVDAPLYVPPSRRTADVP